MSAFETALNREAAQVIERAISDMRTDAVLRSAWWWPFGRKDYDTALQHVHEEVQAVLDAYGIWHPGASS